MEAEIEFEPGIWREKMRNLPSHFFLEPIRAKHPIANRMSDEEIFKLVDELRVGKVKLNDSVYIELEDFVKVLNPFDKLPNEIILHILQYCPKYIDKFSISYYSIDISKKLLEIGLVCKRFNSLVRNDSLWKYLVSDNNRSCIKKTFANFYGLNILVKTKNGAKISRVSTQKTYKISWRLACDADSALDDYYLLFIYLTVVDKGLTHKCEIALDERDLDDPDYVWIKHDKKINDKMFRRFIYEHKFPLILIKSVYNRLKDLNVDYCDFNGMLEQFEDTIQRYIWNPKFKWSLIKA